MTGAAMAGKPKMTDDEYAKRRAEMTKLRGEGLTNVEIGEQFGITKQRVSEILSGVPHPESRSEAVNFRFTPREIELLERVQKLTGETKTDTLILALETLEAKLTKKK